MKIVKLSTIIICMLAYVSSCKKNATAHLYNEKFNSNNSILRIKNKLPYTSENTKQYYKLDTDSICYVTNISNNSFTIANFNREDNSIPIKENDFEVKLDFKYHYYVLESFQFSKNNMAKLIIYNTFGENDSKLLNIQLNSYVNNHLVDQLLLDCRFTFETEYYRTFMIGTERNIEIVKFQVEKLQYNEQGDIIGEKDIADSVKSTVNYVIDNFGKFKKKTIEEYNHNTF